MLTLLIVVLSPFMAKAEERLQEYQGTPFSLAAQRQLEIELLDHTSQPGYQMATLLPTSTTSVDIVGIRWPRSEQRCYLAIAHSGGGNQYATGPGGDYLLLMAAGREAKPVPLSAGGNGMVNRLCIWPTERSENAKLIILFSLTGSTYDATVYALAVNPDGTFTELDTGGALTLFGWFDCVDLDGDGSFELITSRNLDGTIGGFFYHAVRSLREDQQAYMGAPSGYLEYFEQELAWLDWVVETRGLIQADPTPYLNATGVGHAYVAEYNGRKYGFDSVIEVPLTFPGVENVSEYNQQRRDAFHLVMKYRDELAAWLNGGDYPATWKMVP
ncbi:hypothetical protein JW859_09550 [bacterium]|nr:hypothetical protein [bacterium]